LRAAGADKPRKPRRRAVKDAAAADAAAAADQLHAESLHRLHGTSDNLRALLERRAERQQRAPRPAPGAAAAASPRPLPARAAPAELAAEAAPQRRAARVRFCLNFHVDFGQRVCLVGGSPELGAWVLADAVPLEWGDGDQWHAAVDLPAGSVVEYKYVVVGTGGHAAAWQAGNNSVLALRHADDEVEVYDNWCAARSRRRTAQCVFLFFVGICATGLRARGADTHDRNPPFTPALFGF
jgi:hypothetical protein